VLDRSMSFQSIGRRTLFKVANFESTSVSVNTDSKMLEFEARVAVNNEARK
jgi:hypothetical protein